MTAANGNVVTVPLVKCKPYRPDNDGTLRSSTWGIALSLRVSRLICESRPIVGMAILTALTLTGCAQHAAEDPAQASYLARPYEQNMTSGDAEEKQDLYKAQASFARKAYGLAEKHFRAAIEQDRDDAEAWIGLAASYDQLARYDLADRAYSRLEQLKVDRAVVLNNRGYSHILRGDYPGARRYLLKAQKISPDDVRITRNIALLDDKQSKRVSGPRFK